MKRGCVLLLILPLFTTGCGKIWVSMSLKNFGGNGGAPSYKLVFTTQPSSSVAAGATLPTGGVIKVEDNSGNVITSGALSTATINLSDVSGNGNIAGVTSVTLAGGIATIPNNTLEFEKGGTTSLAATTTASGYGTVTGTSSAINVTLPTLTTVSAFSGPDNPNGDVDGNGTGARLNYPESLVGYGGYIYIGEMWPACVIRRYQIASPYAVTTWVGQLYNCGFTDGATGTNTIGGDSNNGGPWYQLATDGTNIYFSDGFSIRAAAISTGTVTTIAGSPTLSGYSDNTTGTSARFGSHIRGLYVNGGTLYVGDTANHYIRAVSLTPPYAVTTVAGNGTGGIQDSRPGFQVEVDKTDGFTGDATNLYFNDYDGTNNYIRQMAFTGNAVTTDVNLSSTCNYVSFPSLAVIGTTLYFGCGDSTIQSATIGTWTFAVDAGIGWSPGEVDGGVGTSQLAPADLWGSGTSVYIADAANGALRMLDNTNTVTTLAGTPNAGSGNTGSTTAVNSRFTQLNTLVGDGTTIYGFAYGSQQDGIAQISMANGSTGSVLTPAGFASQPYQSATDLGGKIYYIKGCQIDLFDPTGDTLTVIAGTGTCAENSNVGFSSAEFKGPTAIATDQNNIYVFDDNAIKKLDMSTQTVTVLSGTVGTSGCTTGSSSASLYKFTDHMAYLNGNLYFSQLNCNNNQIVQVSTTTGASVAYAGNGSCGAANGALLSASFGGCVSSTNESMPITTDGTNLYILDALNGLVREISGGTVSTLYGSTSQMWDVDGSLANARERALNPLYSTQSIYYGYGKLYIGHGRGVRVVY